MAAVPSTDRGGSSTPGPARYRGRTAIVTGGNRGIGRAIVERLAAEGAEVLVAARDAAAIEATVAAVGAAGGRAWGVRVDVSDDGDLEQLMAEATARWSRIDVLVNNAGIAHETPFLEIPRAQWDEVVGVNLRAPFVLSQLVAREMLRTGGGAIVHIASIDASGGEVPFASYGASKAALLGLNRAMAIELAAHGIRVNCVSPGVTRTEMTWDAVAPGVRERLDGGFERVPARRLVEPSEIAAAVAYLASDDASGITGIELTVDLGLTANLYVLETLAGARSPSDGQSSSGG